MEQSTPATPKKDPRRAKEGAGFKSQIWLRLMGGWVVFEAACAFQGPLRAGFISLFEFASPAAENAFEEAVTRL